MSEMQIIQGLRNALSKCWASRKRLHAGILLDPAKMTQAGIATAMLLAEGTRHLHPGAVFMEALRRLERRGTDSQLRRGS